MSEISDEMLMAYADGALDDAERRRIARYIQSSAEGRARLDAFVATGSVLNREFAPMLRWQVPAYLADTVMTAPISTPPAVAALRNTHGIRPPDGLMSRLIGFFALPMPMGWTASACAAALLIGGIGGWAMKPGATSPAGGNDLIAMTGGKITAAGGLARVLDTAPAKTTVAFAAGGRDVAVTPVVSFKSQSGAFCRQYDGTLAAGERFSGLGCRQADGRWSIEAHTSLAARQATPEGVSRPAGRDGSPVIDAVAGQLIDGAALQLDAEAALIKNGWKQ